MSVKGQVFVFTGAKGKVLGVRRKRVVNMLTNNGFKVFYFKPPGPLFFLDSAHETETNTNLSSKEEIAEFVALKSLDHEVNIAIGASAGGFPALRYAVENGFTGMLGYSAFTNFNTDSPNHDRRASGEVGNMIYEAMHKLEPDNSKRNVQGFLDAHEYTGQIHLNYPTKNEGDTYQAENLKNYDAVTLLPQDAEPHNFFDQANTNLRQCWRRFERKLNLKATVEPTET